MDLSGELWHPLGASGTQVVVTLVSPMLAKDGNVYRYIRGLGVLGFIQDHSSPSQTVLRMGTVEADHILTPLTNVAAIQASNKVLKPMDGLLVLEDKP